MLKKKDVIAVDNNGNLYNYYGYEDEITDEILEQIDLNGSYRLKSDIILKPNYEFYKKIKFVNFSRGCSSSQAMFKDEQDNNYYMFLKDFADLIKEYGYNDILEGMFTVQKRGCNYAIRYLGPTKSGAE